MKKYYGVLIIFMFLFSTNVKPAVANGSSSEIEELRKEVQRLRETEQQLKNDMQRLLDRLDELEKKQSETHTQTVETEKKIAEVEKRSGKSLKDRIHLSGEARFRILRSTGETDRGFYGNGQPSDDIEDIDQTAFPTRVRLNLHAEVAPDIVDFYSRLTMNKRWGAWDTAPSDPFDRPNSFEASIGHDITPRFEQAYMTLKIPTYNAMWYVGRLPGLDGPPARSSRSLFPRLFIDSEIDGTLLSWTAPLTSLDTVALPWTETRLWGSPVEDDNAPVMKQYNAKVKESSGLILGYLKYDEKKQSANEDADVYLAQAQIKVGKDTELILNGLYIDDWHMPNSSDDNDVPDLVTPYWLTGFYADTQLLGCQVYGAYYYSHFKIPRHSWVDESVTHMYDGKGFPGHIWYLGFTTGDLISPTMQFCAEYAKGDDAWINPFNYRGFRRKGTVQTAANNYFYNRNGTNKVVGFYPFNAGVFDAYFDYYYRPNVRFRLGLLDYQFDENKYKEGDYSILGSNKYEHQWWPYFELNLNF